MTLSECYKIIGGNYDDVLRRFRSDERVEKFLRMFVSDPSFAELEESVAERDGATAFRASHTLKGVAENLALEALAAPTRELVETVRGGTFGENTAELFEKVKLEYGRTIDGISRLG